MRRFAQAIGDLSSLPPGLPAEAAQAWVDAPDRYNISKGKPALVLAANKAEPWSMTEMAWGLVPRWSKEPSTPYTTVTARLERAPSSRIFAQAWRERRCILALSGYYKWDRQRRPPWPRFIQRKDGLALLAAGLWERWGGNEDESIATFTLLTGPNAAIPTPLTQDGPVFLDPSTALAWLSGRISSADALERHAEVPVLESYSVGRRIRDANLDDYTLLEPVDPDAEVWEGSLDDELDDDD